MTAPCACPPMLLHAIAAILLLLFFFFIYLYFLLLLHALLRDFEATAVGCAHKGFYANFFQPFCCCFHFFYLAFLFVI